ncbi:MAG: isoaspartyl peptidase/L-asparaginase [Cyclobacteriaceae bacterium]|nr:isoaspartyl peptidase/L-asparaginase [Cyclobacteriaceae bacterium HetDA_MAG_MS6]
MKSIKLTPFLLLCIILSCSAPQSERVSDIDNGPKVKLVIHGGAGTIKRENMDSETEKAYRDKLEEALRAGSAVLDAGGETCEAVMKAINVMENSPLFNAGVGAVFTASGENELDASIMKGDDLNAGAVAGVKTLKNPILAAYEVMLNSPHVMLSGKGAEAFAEEQGLEIVDPDYFKTERRKSQLEKVQKRVEKEFGTVGAVARDASGNICAGTSTGGMTNKKWGRIGDSPVIGAGTYANNATCGVSATGHGEYFIRSSAGFDVSALMDYRSETVADASKQVIDKIEKLGGKGGLIALDAQGNVAMPFSTSGMYRGYITEDGEVVVQIYGDE